MGSGQADCNGTATISLCDSDLDTVAAVYSGCSCPADSIIVCGDDECGGQSEVTISVLSGQSFLIRVGGFNGTTGEGKLNISCNAGACLTNADCDNGAFCDGDESCINNICVGGSSPCLSGETCNEGLNRCDECATDDDCDDSEDCTTDTCLGSGFCEFVTDETDSDDDGTPDCADGCPTDPNKTGEGLCGCGVADTDSDDDGTPDCDDECPDDPFKTLRGICGCGEFDRDLDSDLTTDCIDNCPGLPNESQEDGDNDGVGTACDDCPEDGGLQIDDGGCPLASTWISDRILLGIRRGGYIPPERYELDLTATLVTATLGLSETALAPLGTVLSLNPDVPLGVPTEVFTTEDLFGSITDTVDIQLFQVTARGDGTNRVDWRFIVSVTREESSGTVRNTFDGTQTGTITADGTIIIWQSVIGFKETCTLNDDEFDCSPRIPLVPTSNWPQGGRWTLS